MNIDMHCPIVPDAIFDNPCPVDEYLSQLWQEVAEEVLDETYHKRAHHNVGTYDAGCRGPLCRKALREHPRRRKAPVSSTRVPREERVYDPVMEYFHVVIKHRIRTTQQAILQTIREGATA